MSNATDTLAITPRQVRILKRLATAPASREELDRLAGCSNAPDEIMRLRARGWRIHCVRQPGKDRDGRVTSRGVYSLDPEHTHRAAALLGEVG
ncbi:MAG: hypothetical protein ACOZAQ_03150 [Pseudomonadota bacterium]